MNTLDFILSKNKIEVDKLPYQIANVSRLDLVRWFRELDFKTGVEVGVAEGELSKIICEINPQLKLYGIDPYVPYDGYADYQKESTFQRLKEQAEQRLAPYVTRDRYELIEDNSMRAVQTFDDDILDFVYIDGNHQDPYVTEDITEWTKKVRSGGIVAGHDYMRIASVQWQVKDAINKYTKENNIDPWFILGLDKITLGVVREGARSWMFVKT